MTISKIALNAESFARPIFEFESARSALKAYLLSVGVCSESTVLLPSYIGWSPREGSGVLDPIQEIGCKIAFYRVRRNLTIDVDDYLSRVCKIKPAVVVLIHYFGFADCSTASLAKFAAQNGALVVEDEAHALLTDLIGGQCGRYGDACIYSLHKLLPVNTGGALVLNSPRTGSNLLRSNSTVLTDYDLYSIAMRRRQNAMFLLECLRATCPNVEPLFSEVPEGFYPQTLPVLIHSRSRDDLYFRMNDLGFGVVSLYHTLVTCIAEDDFPDSHWVSRRIMNLPVHQDAGSVDLETMVSHLERFTA